MREATQITICNRCSDTETWKQLTWKKEVATEDSASVGHSRNQSMVQQLTTAGNMRSRCLQGDKVKHALLLLQIRTNYLLQLLILY